MLCFILLHLNLKYNCTKIFGACQSMSKFKNNIFLITGASGFVGSYLLRKLAEKEAQIHIILRKSSKTWRIKDILDKVNIHTGDLTKFKEVQQIVNRVRPTIIYHLASYGAYPYQKNVEEILKTNVFATWNVLKAVANHQYKLLVNTGSSSEYGFKKKPMKETDILEPASYYAITKCTQTYLCSHTANESHKPIVTLRPFSVYGPYEEPSRLIPTLLKSLYVGEKMSLVSPHIARDLIYISDMIDAYLKIKELQQYPGKTFNIGTGIQSSIEQIVKTAFKVTDKKIKLEWGRMQPRSWDTTNWVANISLAKNLLRWEPKYNLSQGLYNTWEWFNNNHKFYI